MRCTNCGLGIRQRSFRHRNPSPGACTSSPPQTWTAIWCVSSTTLPLRSMRRVSSRITEMRGLLVLILLTIPASAVTVDRIAATVDRQVLTVSEITQMVGIRFFPRTADSEEEHRRNVLDALIAQALRYRDVERFGAQDIPADAIEARLLEIQRRFASEAELAAAVAEAELTLDEVRALVKRQLQVEAYIQERVAALGFIPN